MTVIRESKHNRDQRLAAIHFIHFTIIVSLILFVLQILLFNKYFALLAIFPIAIAFFLKKRVAKLSSFEDKRIVFTINKKSVPIAVNEIIYVSKAVRFTFTQRFWLIIRYRKENKSGFLFFVNEPDFHFLDLFSNLGVKLKNMP